MLSFDLFFFLMIRRPPRSTLSSSSAASDVYKRQLLSSTLPMRWTTKLATPASTKTPCTPSAMRKCIPESTSGTCHLLSIMVIPIDKGIHSYGRSQQHMHIIKKPRS
eukprot:TRINITY_DN47365_c0_g1_i1.p2 TRINITY_DN47365_c0_g1~~TRINITY_DN47365_c0_g1_i1.p2  ORF type:complete len:107 (+),score=30.90 TRINITY_DN47365_c0_g1_i1:50-370(+)